MLSYQQALDKLLAAARPVAEVRSLPLTAALGRVLAVPQRSTVAVPPSAAASALPRPAGRRRAAYRGLVGN
jgi:molybdopterin biosynthesis enzyme